jgi:hypothetical protein
MSTKLDQQQLLQKSFDETSECLKVKLDATSMSMELDAADGDSVRAYNGEEPIAFYDNYIQALSVGNTVVTRTYRNGLTVVGTVVYTYSDNTRTFLLSMQRS